MILAILFSIPSMTRSQNEGVKPVSNPKPADQTLLYTRTTRDMAMIQEQGTTGGAPMPSSLYNTNTSCYLEPGWAEGQVVLSDHSTLENIMLRYDLYHQQLQFIKDGDTLAFANPGEIRSFNFGNHQFINTSYQAGDLAGKAYFELILEGKCDLLARRTVKYHFETESNPDLQEELYVRECTYYLSINNEIAKQVKIGRNSVLSALSDKHEEVSRFMDENKLKMNSCDQLKMVVNYYNSLQ